MESLSSESKSIALDILEDILSAIEKVEERTKDIRDTRAQLEAISDALMELQNQGKNPLELPEIGYTAIQKRREKEEKK